MRRAVYLLILVISAYLILLLATLPARTVFSWFTNDELRAFGIEGSIWRGSAASLVVGQTRFSPVTWKFTAGTLFALRLGFQVEAQQPDGFVWTRIEVSPLGTVAFKDLQATLPVDSLSKNLRLSGLGGELNAHMSEILLDTGWPSRLDGSVQINRLRVDMPQSELLGGYILTFADQRSEPLLGRIEDLDGPLEVEGTLTLNKDRSYLLQGLISARPSASTQLDNALGFIGPAQPGGGHRFSLEGRL